MCADCEARIRRWEATTPAVCDPGLRIAAHAAYDGTPAGVADNRRARYERWRRLVASQTDLIRRTCPVRRGA